MSKMKKLLRNILAVLIIVAVLYVSVQNFLQGGVDPEPVNPNPPVQQTLDENEQYNDYKDVALYLHLYGHLPSNFVTKTQAKKLYGWENGPLDKLAPGYSIGGGGFGNNEGILPEKEGRQYYECDIDTVGKDSRGAKRIVYSNDGLIYYTDDHYETFTLLYGEE